MLIYRSMMEQDAEKKLAMRKDLADNKLPLWLGMLDKLVAQNSTPGFAVGSSLTVADFNIDGTLKWLQSGVLDNVPPSVVDPFSNLLKIQATVAADPKVKEWREKNAKK